MTYQELERMESLVAVLLVVRSRPGPQLVYRYPRNAERRGARQRKRQSDDSNSDSDGDINGISSVRVSHKAKPSHESTQTAVNLEDKETDQGHFLGFSEDGLEKLLAPGAWCDRKKFEVCLDGLMFVGHPIHAHEDGRWTRKEVRGPHGIDHAASNADDQYGDYTNFGITVTEPLSPVRKAQESSLVHESLDSQLVKSLGTSMNSASSTSTTTAEQLQMFNVVFVFDTLGGGGTESTIADAYKHVLRKLSKALHYCQKQSNYVGIETRRMLSLYNRAKQDHTSSTTLQQQVVDVSELAWALKVVYESISTGKIAGIRLNGQAISLHVPLKQSEQDDQTELDQSAGLLLLEDKGALLHELSHPDASPLAHFIREHTPTKSLQKLAPRLGMSVEEALYLARHIIKWRKARAIMPLHPRNTYIVQPHAPADRLEDFMNDYARRFPGLPLLPQMLKFLSAKPIKYGMLMPSRDHRAPYMEILGYLVRHEFVAPLKTFGWLRRVPPRSKRNEKEKGEPVNQNRTPLSVASLLSPQLKAVDDDVASVSSERTAIPLNGMQRSRMPVQESSLQFGGEAEKAGEEEVDHWNIILDPVEPSDEEAEFLENVRYDIDDEDLSDRLPALLKYFNGEEALEGIAAREGLKRSLVERWLDLLQRGNLITTFRRL